MPESIMGPLALGPGSSQVLAATGPPRLVPATGAADEVVLLEELPEGTWRVTRPDGAVLAVDGDPSTPASPAPNGAARAGGLHALAWTAWSQAPDQRFVAELGEDGLLFLADLDTGRLLTAAADGTVGLAAAQDPARQRWCPASWGTVAVAGADGLWRRLGLGADVDCTAAPVSSFQVPPGLALTLRWPGGAAVATRDGTPPQPATSVRADHLARVQAHARPGHTGPVRSLGLGVHPPQDVASLQIPPGLEVRLELAGPGGLTRAVVLTTDAAELPRGELVGLRVRPRLMAPPRQASFEEPGEAGVELFGLPDYGEAGVHLGPGDHDLQLVCPTGSLGSARVPPGLTAELTVVRGRRSIRAQTVEHRPGASRARPVPDPITVDLPAGAFDVEVRSTWSVDDRVPPPGRVALRTPGGRWATVLADGRMLDQRTGAPDLWEFLLLLDAGDGQVVLISEAHGNPSTLTQKDGRVSWNWRPGEVPKYVLGPGERLTLERDPTDPPGTYAVRGGDGRYLSAAAGLDQGLTFDRATPGPTERFGLRWLGAAQLQDGTPLPLGTSAVPATATRLTLPWGLKATSRVRTAEAVLARAPLAGTVPQLARLGDRPALLSVRPAVAPAPAGTPSTVRAVTTALDLRVDVAIAIRTSAGLCLSADWSGGGREVEATAVSAPDRRESFDLVPVGDGWHGLRTVAFGDPRWVTCIGTGVTHQPPRGPDGAPGPDQRFTLEPAGAGRFALRVPPYRPDVRPYLLASGQGPGSVRADGDQGDPATTFTLVPQRPAALVLRGPDGTPTTVELPLGTLGAADLDLPTDAEPQLRVPAGLSVDLVRTGGAYVAAALPTYRPRSTAPAVPGLALTLRDPAGRATRAGLLHHDPAADHDGIRDDDVPVLLEDEQASLTLELATGPALTGRVLTLELRLDAADLLALPGEAVLAPPGWKVAVRLDPWSLRGVVALTGVPEAPGTVRIDLHALTLAPGDVLDGALDVWVDVAGLGGGPVALPLRVARRGRTPLVAWRDADGGTVIVSRSVRRPVANTLALTLRNPDPRRPLVDRSRPWSGTPRFVLRFDDPTTQARGRGALWTAAWAAQAAARPTLRLVDAVAGAWTHDAGGEGELAFTIQPTQDNHAVLRGGEVLTVRLDGVVSDVGLDAAGDADTTQLHLAWYDVPGIPDGATSLPITKRDTPRVALRAVRPPAAAPAQGAPDDAVELTTAPLLAGDGTELLGLTAFPAELAGCRLDALPGAPWAGARDVAAIAAALESTQEDLRRLRAAWWGTGRVPLDQSVPPGLRVLVAAAFAARPSAPPGTDDTAPVWADLDAAAGELRAITARYAAGLDALRRAAARELVTHPAIVAAGETVTLDYEAMGVDELRLSRVLDGRPVTLRSRRGPDGWDVDLRGPHRVSASTSLRLEGFDLDGTIPLDQAELAVDVVAPLPVVEELTSSPRTWTQPAGAALDARLAWRTLRATEVVLRRVKPDGGTEVLSTQASGSVSCRITGRAVFELEARSEDGVARRRLVLGRTPPCDFDGDGRSEPALWRPADATWRIRRTDGTIRTLKGRVGDVPAPGDYDGEGRTQAVVWRPPPADGPDDALGSWVELREDGPRTLAQLGRRGDVPVPADYEGTGRCVPAVWRPGDGTWERLSDGARAADVTLGRPGDRPVPGDYVLPGGEASATGRAWPAVFRPATAEVLVLDPATGRERALAPGRTVAVAQAAALVAVPGDYRGAGSSVPATWEPGGAPAVPAPPRAEARVDATSFALTAAPPAATRKVSLYPDPDFRGDPKQLEVGSKTVLSDFENRTKSVRVPAGLRVELWEHFDHKPEHPTLVLVDDAASMPFTPGNGIDWAGTVSYVEVSWAGREPSAGAPAAPSPTRLWSQPALTGSQQSVAAGTPLTTPAGSLGVDPADTVSLRTGPDGPWVAVGSSVPSLGQLDAGAVAPTAWEVALTGTETGAQGVWTVGADSSGASLTWAIGLPGDVPVPGDFDGGGKLDAAVWRPAGGRWRFADAKPPGLPAGGLVFGRPGDVPVGAPPALLMKLCLPVVP